MKKVLSLLVATILMMVLFIPLLSVSAASNDVAGIRSGYYYYIKNLYTGKYLDVQGGGTDYSGQNVIAFSFHGGNNQQWKANRNSNGTYTFPVLFSSSGRVLDVTAGNVDIYSPNYPTDQQFTLVRDNTMAYGGSYYIKWGSQFVTANVSTGDVTVTTSGGGLNSMWSFIEVSKGDADIYASYYKDGQILIFPTYFDTRGAISTFHDKLGGIGYNTYDFVNTSASTAYSYMQNDSIFVTRGHGSPSAVYFYDSSGNAKGRIIADASFGDSSDQAINSLSANALAKLKCVLYIGCSPGSSWGSHNLVRSTYNKGAHFALGPTSTVYTGDATPWTKYFLNKAYEGGTIRQCIDNANYYEKDLGLLYYYGDTYKTLK